MNDRFKFRAWFHGGGDPRVEGSMRYSHPFPVLFWEDVGNVVLAVEVMQCTGLPDKHGKLIFEGDILQWQDNFLAEVNWSEEDAGFAIKTSNGGGAMLGDEYCKNFEIIGNIYEHPELLEGSA